MNSFNHIQSKLQEFVKKFYTNELIKGIILFFSFGLLYFIFTLFIESVLWLKPTARTFLFWIFILVESIFIIKYILIPIAKLVGLKKGISSEEASMLIGKHFSEIDDKLLNVLQLSSESSQSELLVASIEQKSKGLEPIPFKHAINYSTNRKYLKYLAIPVLIWLTLLVSGNKSNFSDSYNRVVHHHTAYEPPAPFSFNIINNSLEVIEGKPITIEVEVVGKVLPEDVQIHFSNQQYFLQGNGIGKFEYTFNSIQDPLEFYLESGKVSSRNYGITVIKTPNITTFEMFLDYPSYTKMKDELIKNTGSAVIPQGTIVSWKLKTRNTNIVSFISSKEEVFENSKLDDFEFEKKITTDLTYQIATSNDELKNYEKLEYTLNTIIDAYPKIDVRSDIDSITRGPVQFAGQISDDYGLSKLELVYYDKMNSMNPEKQNIQIDRSEFESFFYVFPEGIDLKEGIEYELYFEVFDNDRVNGIKSTKSPVFSYYKKTEQELVNQVLEEQKETIEDLEKSVEKSKLVNEEFQKIQEGLQNKSDMNWNDQKKLENFMQRQQQYDNMMQKQTEQLDQNLEEQSISKNEDLENKKKEIQQRIKESKELAKQEELIEELKKLAEKLDKEELTEKLKKLTENNRRNEQNLERLLELTKRFYVEQKSNQIKEKLEELSKEQTELSNGEENNSEKQEELNAEFEKLKEELDNLDKENKDLQRPMKLPDMKKEEESVDKDMNEAKENLEQSESKENTEESEKNKKSASKKQKSAAQKMKQMSQKMQESMQSMQGESMDEDIEMLRAILENLIEFSFQQEELMEGFSSIDNAHPDYSNKLKKQFILRDYFEHIDDSLYTLSMRQPKLGTEIFKNLSDAHYHIDESLVHFADNQFDIGLADQQFVMTSTNNIAVLLSDILNGMQNASASMGQGKGDSFGLPDIIQKQEDAIENMEEGMKKGEKTGDKEGEKEDKKEGENGQKSGNGQGEEMNGELYEIYKEQVQLRQLLEDALKEKKDRKGNPIGEGVLKDMERLEQDLLEKGFNNETLQKMMQLKHELLKLEEAAYKQGNESKRESNSNSIQFENREIKKIDDSKLWFNQNEILYRQSLPFNHIYKEKVKQYFKVNDSIQ